MSSRALWGLSGNIRGMKVREERILAELAKRGGQIDELLDLCWQETLEPGPYVFGGGGKVEWGKALQGDRSFALLMVRRGGPSDSRTSNHCRPDPQRRQ